MRRRAPGSATECWRARQAFCSDKYCPSRRFLRGGRHPMLEIEVGIPTSILVSCDHSPGPRLEIEARGSNLARAYSNCRSMVISDSRWWVPPFGDHEARRTLTPKASPSCDAIRLGGPGGLLPQGSHGPGRADFPHPVRQFMVSLRDRPSARHERVAEEIPRATDSCAPTSTLFSTIVG